MDKLETKIKEQIEKVKSEIVEITNQIEDFRNDGEVDNVGVGQELLDRLDLLSERVNSLKKNLVTYQSSKAKDTIDVGHTVEISKSSISKSITLVLPDDADSTGGFISVESPVGQALRGKRVGENVVVVTPAGNQEFVISKVA